MFAIKVAAHLHTSFGVLWEICTIPPDSNDSDEKNPMPNEVNNDWMQSHMWFSEVHHGRCGEAAGEVVQQKCRVMKENKLCKNGSNEVFTLRSFSGMDR